MGSQAHLVSRTQENGKRGITSYMLLRVSKLGDHLVKEVIRSCSKFSVTSHFSLTKENKFSHTILLVRSTFFRYVTMF